jgi:glycosyltransferase involved in cell wall biosynthesis
MTVHLVYPHQNKISAPDVIGYALSRALLSIGPVITYDWDSIGKIVPNPNDILIGHPHPFPFTIFRRSLHNNNWSRVIILQPFNLDVNQVGYIDSIIDRCDRFLAITGKYWFDQIDQSCLSRWSTKMVHIDMAVDRNSFPRIKKKFNIPGKRKFIYIGNDNPVKNVSFLSKIAQALPEYCFAWAGKGADHLGLQRLGHIDFSSNIGKELVSQYDFMITVGTADANPTTILEAISWGLVPVCTPTSGYENIPGIVNVPTNDLDGAVSVLKRLQNAPEVELLSLVSRADEMLTTHFNWDRFCGQVIDALESDDSPLLPRCLTVRSVDRLNKWPYPGVYRMFGYIVLNNLKYWLKNH